MERQLVTVRTVGAVHPIDGADRIERAVIDGWNVVIGRGEFAPGDRVVYFEIDSALPLDDARFAFLGPRGTKTLAGKDFHILRTAKLRGVVSQGLALPFASVPETGEDDIAGALGVFKYEPPIPAELSGLAVGPFPTEFASKTDAERVQNLASVYDTLRASGPWQATEKIDGSSITYIVDGGRLRVCSRNYELVADPSLTSVQIAHEEKLLDEVAPGHVLQCELAGPSVQKNPLRLPAARLFVFAVWRDRRQLPRSAWPAWALERAAPIYPEFELPETVEAAVAQADGIRSLVSPSVKAEGIVWHRVAALPLDELDARSCFKAISNAFLLS